MILPAVVEAPSPRPGPAPCRRHGRPCRQSRHRAIPGRGRMSWNCRCGGRCWAARKLVSTPSREEEGRYGPRGACAQHVRTPNDTRPPSILTSRRLIKALEPERYPTLFPHEPPPVNSAIQRPPPSAGTLKSRPARAHKSRCEPHHWFRPYRWKIAAMYCRNADRPNAGPAAVIRIAGKSTAVSQTTIAAPVLIRAKSRMTTTMQHDHVDAPHKVTDDRDDPLG